MLDPPWVLAHGRQGSDLTKQRLEKDRQRDALYKEIRKTIDTFAALSIFPDKQEAALKMQPMLQKYTLDGRRLPAKPTAKGLYINKGNKVFIK